VNEELLLELSSSASPTSSESMESESSESVFSHGQVSIPSHRWEERKDSVKNGSESPACCSSQDHKDCLKFQSHIRSFVNLDDSDDRIGKKRPRLLNDDGSNTEPFVLKRRRYGI
jgi:hypothetical protein